MRRLHCNNENNFVGRTNSCALLYATENVAPFLATCELSKEYDVPVGVTVFTHDKEVKVGLLYLSTVIITS
jgi:hypothetical protein